MPKSWKHTTLSTHIHQIFPWQRAPLALPKCLHRVRGHRTVLLPKIRNMSFSASLELRWPNKGTQTPILSGAHPTANTLTHKLVHSLKHTLSLSFTHPFSVTLVHLVWLHILCFTSDRFVNKCFWLYLLVYLMLHKSECYQPLLFRTLKTFNLYLLLMR